MSIPYRHIESNTFVDDVYLIIVKNNLKRAGILFISLRQLPTTLEMVRLNCKFVEGDTDLSISS